MFKIANRSENIFWKAYDNIVKEHRIKYDKIIPYFVSKTEPNSMIKWSGRKDKLIIVMNWAHTAILRLLSYTMYHTLLQRRHFNNSLHLDISYDTSVQAVLNQSLFLSSLKHKQLKNIASEHKKLQ